MKIKARKRLSAFVALALCLPLMCGILVGTGKVQSAHAAESYTVKTYDPMQTFDGWGTSLIWWANNVGKYDWEAGGGDTTVREEIMELLYGKDGLEYNIARFNVGGGDNPNHSHVTAPQHMEGYSTLDESFLPVYSDAVNEEVTDWSSGKVTVSVDEEGNEVKENKKDAWTMDDVTYVWENNPDYTEDAAQRWCMEWIYANAEKLGTTDELISEFFSNSPPWYMTKSACASGAVGSTDSSKRDNLLDGRADEFAKYFVDVLLHLVKDKGYRFEYVDPFNESTSGWWPARSQKQEGCYLTNQQRADVLSCLVDELDKHPELADIKIAFDDSTGADKAWEAYKDLRDNHSDVFEKIKPRLGKLNYHLYEGSANGEISIAEEAEKQGWQNWMSEMGYKSDKSATSSILQTGYLHTDKIRETIYNGANAYVLWQVIEELSSQMNSLDYGYGPIKVSYYSVDEVPELANYGYTLGSYYVSKQYYMLGQYSKYIRPGYKILPTSDDKGVAAISPDGKKVVVVHANNSDTADDLEYTLMGHYITNAQVIVTDENQSWAKSSLAASGNKFSYRVNPYSVTTFVFDVEQYAEKPVEPNKTEVSIKNGGVFTKLDSGVVLPEISDINTDTYTENRFYLTNGWSGYDGNSQWVQGNSDGSVGAFIKFTNTVEADFVFKCKKNGANDAGSLTFELYEGTETTATQTQSGLKATSENGGDYQVIWRVKDLDKTKKYAVRIIVSDNQWTNLSRVDLYDAARLPEPTYEAPRITAATVKGGNLYVSVTEETPASEYKVYWREAGTNVVNQKTVPYGSINGTAVATSLGGNEYDIWVSDTAGEKYSQTVTVRNASVDGKLLYYVNAATANAGSYSIYERAAVNNTYLDQAFGADPVTGKEWGLVSEGNAKYASGKAGTIYQSMGDVVSTDGNADGEIVYKFEVGNTGTFDIMLGVICPWAARPEEVSINGDSVGEFNIDQNENFISITNISPDADGYITVKASIPEGETEGGVLGTIMVAKNGDTANAFATAAEINDVTPTGAATNAKHYRFGGLTAGYVEKIDIDGAFVYGVDGAKKSAEDVTFDSFAITNTTPNAEAGRITGVADGLYFTTPLTLTSTKATIYYYVDCGSDGSNAAAPGSLQGGVADQESSSGSWGYVNVKGNAWAGWSNEGYLNSCIADINKGDSSEMFHYVFTGLTEGETVDIEVGAKDPNNWGGRSFEVWFGTNNEGYNKSGNSKLGTVEVPGSAYAKLRVRVESLPADTCYMFFHKTKGGDPFLSYITIATPADDTPAAPTLDKTEASKTDTVKVSGLTAGDLLVLNTVDGARIGEVAVTGATMDVDLGKFPIPADAQAVMFSVRHDGSLAESNGTMVTLPQVIVSNIREEWSQRNVLHFAPSVGVTIQDLTVIAPSGRKTNLTHREYFNYVVTENGEYTVKLTTKSNTAYTQSIVIDNLDRINISAEYDKAWTANDVTATVRITYSPASYTSSASSALTSALGEVYINGEKQELKDTYTVKATENSKYTIKAVSVTGREFEYVLDITNIDKAQTKYTVTPDFTAADGFIASLESGNISGGTFRVTKGETEYASANGLRLVEAGEYTVEYTSGLGNKQSFKVNLAYGTSALKSVAATIDGNILNVTSGTVHVYRLGSGEEISASSGGYELAEGHRYMMYAETNEGYEAMIVTVEGSPKEAEGSSGGKKGCRGDVTASGFILAMIALSAAAAVVFVRRTAKGGKRA